MESKELGLLLSEAKPVAQVDSVLYFKALTELLDSNEIIDSRELAERLGTTHEVVRTILIDPSFVSTYHQVKQNLAKVQFDTVGVKRLLGILTSNEESSKNAIAAHKELRESLYPKESKGLTVNISVDKVLDELESEED